MERSGHRHGDCCPDMLDLLIYHRLATVMFVSFQGGKNTKFLNSPTESAGKQGKVTKEQKGLESAHALLSQEGSVFHLNQPKAAQEECHRKNIPVVEIPQQCHKRSQQRNGMKVTPLSGHRQTSWQQQQQLAERQSQKKGKQESTKGTHLGCSIRSGDNLRGGAVRFPCPIQRRLGLGGKQS